MIIFPIRFCYCNRLQEAVEFSPFTNSAQRRPKYNSSEPDDVTEARAALAQCTGPEDRHRLSRVVYRRRKRKWLAEVAREKFAKTALTLPRTDKSASYRTQWMYV